MEIRWTQKAQDDLERIYRFACHIVASMLITC